MGMPLSSETELQTYVESTHKKAVSMSQRLEDIEEAIHPMRSSDCNQDKLIVLSEEVKALGVKIHGLSAQISGASQSWCTSGNRSTHKENEQPRAWTSNDLDEASHNQEKQPNPVPTDPTRLSESSPGVPGVPYKTSGGSDDACGNHESHIRTLRSLQNERISTGDMDHAIPCNSSVPTTWSGHRILRTGGYGECTIANANSMHSNSAEACLHNEGSLENKEPTRVSEQKVRAVGILVVNPRSCNAKQTVTWNSSNITIGTSWNGSTVSTHQKYVTDWLYRWAPQYNQTLLSS